MKKTKICNKCKKDKELFKFHKRDNGKQGVRSICKECYKKVFLREKKTNPEKLKKQKWKTRLKTTYNLSINEYKEMLKKQNGVCAICFKSETRKVHNIISRLSVDHNHVTGKIRGLLCDRCNKSLGGFRDDINILLNAIKYIKGE